MRFKNPLSGRSGLFASVAGGAVLAAVMVMDGIKTTPLNEVRLVTQGGNPVSVLSPGYDFKIPFFQSTYDLRTDMIGLDLPTADIAIQNGTITVEKLQSKVFVRLNGSRSQQEETARIIFEKMRDFHARILDLAAKTQRDTVRGTIIATADDLSELRSDGGDTKATAKEEQIAAAALQGRPNFLDTERVGRMIVESLQRELRATLGSDINVGTEEQPRYLPRVEVTSFALGNFEWDSDYQSRRTEIQKKRSDAEKARYAQIEGEREAAGKRAVAQGEKDAAILRAEGQAEGIKLVQNAEAEGIGKRIKAAGGSSEQLVNIIEAERWNGSRITISGATPIIDARQDKEGTVIPAAPKLAR